MQEVDCDNIMFLKTEVTMNNFNLEGILMG